MSEPTKSLSDLMDELSSALTDLSDKMGSLTDVLETNYLDPAKQDPAIPLQTAPAQVTEPKTP